MPAICYRRSWACVIETFYISYSCVMHTSNSLWIRFLHTLKYTLPIRQYTVAVRSKHVQHVLWSFWARQIRYSYARNAFLVRSLYRRMSNVQVTCVNNRITYGLRMQSVWSIRWYTSKSFVHGKWLLYNAVRPAYFSLLVTFPQRIRRSPSVFPKCGTRRRTLAKTSRCDRAIKHAKKPL